VQDLFSPTGALSQASPCSDSHHMHALPCPAHLFCPPFAPLCTNCLQSRAASRAAFPSPAARCAPSDRQILHTTTALPLDCFSPSVFPCAQNTKRRAATWACPCGRAERPHARTCFRACKCMLSACPLIARYVLQLCPQSLCRCLLCNANATPGVIVRSAQPGKAQAMLGPSRGTLVRLCGCISAVHAGHCLAGRCCPSVGRFRHGQEMAGGRAGRTLL